MDTNTADAVAAGTETDGAVRPGDTVDLSTAAIVSWCRQYLADLLEVPADTIDPAADFDRLGVDSALAVSLLMDVEERYGVDLAPEELFENPTLNAVAAHLHARATESAV